MPVVLKVTWADKADHPDPCQRIRHIGGKSGQLHWKHSYAQAIEAIEQGLFNYYVEKDDQTLNLGIGRAPNGGKFLKTQADDCQPKLLMNLPEPPRRSRP